MLVGDTTVITVYEVPDNFTQLVQQGNYWYSRRKIRNRNVVLGIFVGFTRY